MHNKGYYLSSTKYIAVLFSKCQLCYNVIIIFYNVTCLYGGFNHDFPYLYLSYTYSIKVMVE